MRTYGMPILLFFLLCILASHTAVARTIEFETTEVTAADVALSPDGQWLIFTMLGHLFRLPVEGLPRRSPQGEVVGGTAEQLTFGPYYDTEPVFSPDGTRVAFVSDRDASEDNIFVLELATGQITQVTHEPWAGRPTWTPDGQGIVYLRFVPEAAHYWRSNWGPIPSLVRRVPLSGGEPETLSAPPREIRSLFHLPDGRLAWTVLERQPKSARVTTRIEVMSPHGRVSTLRLLEGIGDRVVASPTGDGLYCRRVFPLYWRVAPEHLLLLPLPEGGEQLIIPVSGSGRGRGSGRWHWGPRFAVAADNKTLYVGDAGRLWKIALPGGAREPIPLRARVSLEIQDPVPPPKWAPPALGSSAPPRSVLWPRLSPDGRSLVFGAAGYLWQQVLDGGQAPLRPGFGGQAQRLFEGSAFEFDPAFSPDGRQLSFASGRQGKDEIKVLSFETRQTRTLASGDLHWNVMSWSRDAQRLVFAEHDRDRRTHRVVAVNVSDGKREKLADLGAEYWESLSRLQLSADGQSLYFTADGTLYRLQLEEKAKPEPITRLARHIADARVSPDEKWLAFRRKIEIWVAPLSKEPVTEEDVRQLSPEADTFAFTPDSSAVIYAAGNRVWRQPLRGGEQEEIPIRLELQRPTPRPLLLRRVRVLDFAAGAFGRETSLYMEQGRIVWIGSERGRRLPRGTVILDAGGRFAIPGLFDMHVHTGFDEQAAMLAYGVTSVRNVGFPLDWVNALADRSEATSDPVARHFYSGDLFLRAPPDLGEDDRALIENEHDARAYVRRWKQWGVHFIKAWASLSWTLHRAVADEARRQGLPVVGHGENVEEMTKSVTLGYWTLEHSASAIYDDVLQMLALAGTRWDPTWAVIGGGALLLRDEPERLADAKFRAFYSGRRIQEAQRGSFVKAIGDRGLRGFMSERLAGIRAAHRRGVKLLAGTDTPGAEAFPGASLQWELEGFVQAGIPPLDVLRIATQEAAAAVGAEDDLGTLEPGKLADIVLLDKNPLEDIRNTQTIWRVIKGGWLFDPDKLRPPESTKVEE